LTITFLALVAFTVGMSAGLITTSRSVMDDATPHRIPITHDQTVVPFVVEGRAAPTSRLGDAPNPVCIERHTAPHVYVDSDIPVGVTLAEWRAAQLAPRRVRGRWMRLLDRVGGGAGVPSKALAPRLTAPSGVSLPAPKTRRAAARARRS
jgi:hypothetical protein